MKDSIRDLIDISNYAGNRADYTQGGGGNTSVKNFKNGAMLIKASGYKLKDITENNGFVAVDRNKIKEFYDSVDMRLKIDYERTSTALTKESVLAIADMPVLRPSVEVGFHSILKKYVIHTHSVFANILTCSKEGEEIAKELFKDKDFGFIFLPYINPGFSLTVAMRDKINEYMENTGKYPEVIFMQNHGLVVTSEYIDRVKLIHTDVNETIRKHFNLEDNFREVKLTEENGRYKSETPIVAEYLRTHELNKKVLDETPLYPDQLVYLNNLMGNDPEAMKVENGTVYYKAEKSKATTLEETLSAYIYVVTGVKNAGLTISKMNEDEVYFINHWEAEKYRRSVSK